MRGAERNFLSTNRDRAQTVLDQQYSNYHGDKEVKEVALKGFKKRYAITSDLQQFYNACKLIIEQWNLQRFL